MLQSVTPATSEVTVNVAGLSAGDYSGVIKYEVPAEPYFVLVPVYLHVTECTIDPQASVPELVFNYQIGDPPPDCDYRRDYITRYEFISNDPTGQSRAYNLDRATYSRSFTFTPYFTPTP